MECHFNFDHLWHSLRMTLQSGKQTFHHLSSMIKLIVLDNPCIQGVCSHAMGLGLNLMSENLTKVGCIFNLKESKISYKDALLIILKISWSYTLLICTVSCRFLMVVRLWESYFHTKPRRRWSRRLVVRCPDNVSGCERHFSMARVTWGEIPSEHRGVQLSEVQLWEVLLYLNWSKSLLDICSYILNSSILKNFYLHITNSIYCMDKYSVHKQKRITPKFGLGPPTFPKLSYSLLLLSFHSSQ